MSPMTGGTMPKPSDDAKAAFTKLMPGEPAITLRPMFGNLSAFVNGNMFCGLFGEDMFVRLPDEQSAPIRQLGGRDFEPMAGRAMKGYVTVPSTWRTKPDLARDWIIQSLAFARALPPKTPASKKKAGAAKRALK